MKFCNGCQTDKPDTEFHFKYKAKGVRQSRCIPCEKRRQRSQYEGNKGYYLKRNMRARAARADLIQRLKSRPCADCGREYPPYVMDFDHRPGTVKKFGLAAQATRYHRTEADILAEAAKCDVVCANCHRVRTFTRDKRCPVVNSNELARRQSGWTWVPRKTALGPRS